MATRMPGAQFFPDATLNFAENLLKRRGDDDALVFWGEERVKRRMSWDELARAGLAAAAGVSAPPASSPATVSPR